MTAIAALAPSRVIGRDGTLPWRLPEDLKFFKQTTWGHIVVMGRTTWESIGRPLPGRENWILSRTLADVAGVRIFRETGQLPPAPAGKTVFVIGGEAVYRALLPRCQELILTLLTRDYEGDAFFPEYEDRFVEAGLVLEGCGFSVRRFVRKP